MKKLFLSMAFAMVAMTMSAQFGVKVAPKYQKGDNVVYRETAVTSAAGQEMTITTETDYKVTEATAEGYTIEATQLKSEAGAGDLMAKLASMGGSAFNGLTIVYQADADGHITGVKNADEVLTAARKAASEALDGILAENPSLPKDVLKAQVENSITAETLLKSVNSSPSPFTLNGKTIMTGGMEKSENNQGMKVKNIYFLTTPDAKKVKVTSALDMTNDELKQLVIDQVKKMAPDQAEMVEQNIDMIMASGQLKFELDQTTDYEFDENGWAKTITVDEKQNAMGQNTTSKTTIERVK